MPEIELWSLMRYKGKMPDGVARNQHEWAAVHAKKIIKNEELNGKFDWEAGGITYTINKRSSLFFEHSVCSKVAQKIVDEFGTDIVIVPVPNSHVVAGNTDSFRTLELARKIANRIGAPASAQDLLRWRAAVGKAHLGERARNVDGSLEKLVINGKADRPVVIFDDFATTGSTLCAAKLKLEAAGVKVAGIVTIMDTIESDERATKPEWRKTKRHPMTIDELGKMLFDEI